LCEEEAQLCYWIIIVIIVIIENYYWTDPIGIIEDIEEVG